MKTIEEFIKQLDGSDDLQNELKEVKDKDALANFLKKNNVSGTVEDFGKAIHAKAEGAISDEDAEAAAGGGKYDPDSVWASYIEQVLEPKRREINPKYLQISI